MKAATQPLAQLAARHALGLANSGAHKILNSMAICGYHPLMSELFSKHLLAAFKHADSDIHSLKFLLHPRSLERQLATQFNFHQGWPSLHLSPWLYFLDARWSSEQKATTVSRSWTHLNVSRCGFTRESTHFHIQYSPGKSRLRPSAEQVDLTAPRSSTLCVSPTY